MNSPTDFNPLADDRQMAGLIGEITGEPIERVLEKLELERRHPGRSVAGDLRSRGVSPYVWGPGLEAFYGSTQAFLYELAVWNRNRLKRQMRGFTARHLARRGRPLDLLSIGDGLGFDSLYFAKKQHRVTYFELPGPSEQFAGKLMERTGSSVRRLTDPTQIPAEAFDAVTCFDVLEHVPDPPAMVRQLAAYLRPGGFLYVSAPFFLILPWYPTHLKANRRFSGSLALYQQAALTLVGGNFAGSPMIFRKPGGEPLPSDHLASLTVRLTAAAQCLGRWTAWPFLPAHLLRRICNRKT